MSAIVLGTLFFLILWIVVAMIIGEYVAVHTPDIRERRGNKQYVCEGGNANGKNRKTQKNIDWHGD